MLVRMSALGRKQTPPRRVADSTEGGLCPAYRRTNQTTREITIEMITQVVIGK